MRKYPIKLLNKDFEVLEANYNAKGKRKKDLVDDRHGDYAFFNIKAKGIMLVNLVLKNCVMSLLKFLDMIVLELNLPKMKVVI